MEEPPRRPLRWSLRQCRAQVSAQTSLTEVSPVQSSDHRHTPARRIITTSGESRCAGSKVLTVRKQWLAMGRWSRVGWPRVVPGRGTGGSTVAEEAELMLRHSRQHSSRGIGGCP